MRRVDCWRQRRCAPFPTDGERTQAACASMGRRARDGDGDGDRGGTRYRVLLPEELDRLEMDLYFVRGHQASKDPEGCTISVYNVGGPNGPRTIWVVPALLLITSSPTHHSVVASLFFIVRFIRYGHISSIKMVKVLLLNHVPLDPPSSTI